MPIYIKGTGNISPQQTWGNSHIHLPVSYASNRLRCIEPDYSLWIAPLQLRRMSRIIKMGVAAAFMALKEAGISHPGGILTGTGFGCLQDTGQFLSQMIQSREEALNPTPFIQSTHNTIGSQIALLLQSHGYNQTYAHDGFSFESALLDAMLQLSEYPDQSLLVGGVDEITDISHRIQSRFGLYRNEVADSLTIFKSEEKGTLHGEGSAWFVLSGTPQPDTASIEAITMLYKPEEAELESNIDRFLSKAEARREDIDLLVLGKSGDARHDRILEKVADEIFPSSSIAVYKHLCGEYPVSTAFALWLSAEILKTKQVPEIILHKDHGRKAQTILIYNQYFGMHHSLLLLKAC